uniref:30S ribosomal protein S20 n=1 Tax=Dictyotopsis propagulifera TaxID=670095 RepID=UPI002E7A0790|nr:30S ribosomal protein S20 [Dictyotopsis propagulifera]WAM63219.1 30S ribosomal protein S20 [Dictyotopsis propagulifera]
MANNNSAKKRIKINTRNNERNSIYKSRIRTFTKKYLISIQDYKSNKQEKMNLSEVEDSLNRTLSQLDKAKKKKVYHKNNIARKKSNLVKLFNQLL